QPLAPGSHGGWFTPSSSAERGRRALRPLATTRNDARAAPEPPPCRRAVSAKRQALELLARKHAAARGRTQIEERGLPGRTHAAADRQGRLELHADRHLPVAVRRHIEQHLA